MNLASKMRPRLPEGWTWKEMSTGDFARSDDGVLVHYFDGRLHTDIDDCEQVGHTISRRVRGFSVPMSVYLAVAINAGATISLDPPEAS